MEFSVAVGTYAFALGVVVPVALAVEFYYGVVVGSPFTSRARQFATVLVGSLIVFSLICTGWYLIA